MLDHGNGETMKRILIALMLVFGLNTANSAGCVVPTKNYIHAGWLNPSSTDAVDTTKADLWAWWWCIGDFDIGYSWRGIAWSAITPENYAAAVAWSMGLNPEFANQVLTLPSDDPRIVALHDEVIRQIRAATDRPTAPKWTVAPNGTAIDRPAYAMIPSILADGSAGPLVRATKSTGRAAIGVQCECALRSVEGSSVYCGGFAAVPPGAPAGTAVVPAVTLCKRVTP